MLASLYKVRNLKANRCHKFWEERAFVVHLAVTMPAPWSGFVLKFGLFITQEATRLQPIRAGATKGSKESKLRASKKAETVSDVSAVQLSISDHKAERKIKLILCTP
jgi:hypothetical protein